MTGRNGGPGPLPNLLIAGVTKAGTTSLFRYLAQHPEVCASSIKEPNYFSAVRFGEPVAPLHTYTRLLAHCSGERYRMEATPAYYPGGKPVAAAIDDVLPQARVIVSFRDPVQRCWSWYRFVRSIAQIPRSLTFPAYLDRCDELARDGVDHLRVHQPFRGLVGGCYDRWLTDWVEVFGERLQIVFFEDIVTSPEAVTGELCGWLGLDATACAGFAYHVENRTVQYRNRHLQWMALSVNRTGERFFARHPELKRALRSAYYRANADSGTERLDDASRARLAAFYAPHNERLAAALRATGLDRLPGWLAVPGRPA